MRSEILLHSFCIIKGIFDVDKHNLGYLSSLFKDHIKSELNSVDDITSFLKELQKYAITYRNFPWIEEEAVFSYEEWEARFFHIVANKKASAIIPFVLFLKVQLEENEKIYQNCLYLLEILILINTDTKNYNKFFSSIISHILSSSLIDDEIYHDLKEKICKTYPNIQNTIFIKDSLLHITNNQDAKLILFWIELYRETQEKDYRDRIGASYHFSLEHLMPKNWDKNWRDISKDEETAVALIYQIGNMTLLRHKLNNGLRNSDWKTKLEGNNTKQGIKKYADLLITRELFDYSEWNAQTINKRTEELTEDFFKVWDIKIFTRD